MVVYSRFIKQKIWCWSWNSNTLATSCEELTHWKRPWCWEGLRAGGEGDDREWDGWMASPTRWAWVWINSWSWWWTGRHATIHGVAKSWTQLSDWTELNYSHYVARCIPRTHPISGSSDLWITSPNSPSPPPHLFREPPSGLLFVQVQLLFFFFFQFMYKWDHTILFVFLISFSIMPFKSICIVAKRAWNLILR